MKDLFSRLYSYKQAENKNSRENFLTEIFAYCLEFDPEFRDGFLFYLLKYQPSYTDFICKTQHFDIENGRPDVYISIDKEIKILIECKVDSHLEKTQLNRYNNLLNNEPYNKNYLVLLTRFEENTTDFKCDFNFIKLRWQEIFDLLAHSKNIISNQLTLYLTSQKMDSSIFFTTNDKNAISSVRYNIQNMDALLFRFEAIMQKYSNVKPNKNSFKDLINYSYYGIYMSFDNGVIWLGFYEYENVNQTQISISFTINKVSKFRNQILKTLTLDNWDQYVTQEGEYEVYKKLNLDTFIVDDKFDITKACDFIESGIKLIERYF